MRNILLSCVSIFFISLIFLGFRKKSPPSKFYYTFDVKKELTPHPTKMILRFLSIKSKDSMNTSLINNNAIRKIQWYKNNTVIVDMQSSSDQLMWLNRFTSDTNLISANPVYLIDKGQEVSFTTEFVVQFKPEISSQAIDSINRRYKVSILKKEDFYYLLSVEPKADVLDIANKFQESGITLFSYPDFIAKIDLNQHIPNDTYFNSQFNFHNTGQVINDGHVGTPGADIKAAEAWSITRGSGLITIAVIDEGVTSNHPDLPNTRQQRLSGSNFGDGNANDPSPTGNSDHGNSCAGLIAATQDNNQGISGLAPNCQIMPIRIFNSDESTVPTSSLANAITFAYTHGADVISNSWGYAGTTDPNAYPVIVTAIQNAVTYGRNNKGSVVVFAVGNTAQHNIGNYGYITFPSNVRIQGVIAVGASDRTDHQSDYSPTGSVLSPDNQFIGVVAPSHRANPESIFGETFEIWSLDIPGANVGYNPWPDFGFDHPPATGERLPNVGLNSDAYTGRFGGTSAACPQVAGLAALILTVAPKLTQFQVSSIIATTADKVGGYNYNNGYSWEMGSGRINACQALISALTSDTITYPAKFLCATPMTLSIPGLAPGIIVNWSITSPGQIVSGQGTSSVVVKRSSNGVAGQITVSATIVTPCGNVNLTPLNLTTGYGSADYPITGPTSACKLQSLSFSTVNLSGATNYQWFWPTGWTYLSGQGTRNLSVRTSTGGGTVGVRVSTECDAGGSPATQFVQVLNCGSLSAKTDSTVVSDVSIFPNPTSSQITVALPDNNVASNSMTIQSNNISSITAVEIYNAKGELKRSVKSISNSNYTISVNDLPNGNYIVVVTLSGKVKTSKTLIITH